MAPAQMTPSHFRCCGNGTTSTEHRINMALSSEVLVIRRFGESHEGDCGRVSDCDGAGVRASLLAAKEGRAWDVPVLVLTEHEDLPRTPEGALFAVGLALKIRGSATDAYVPSGRIGKLNMRDGV